MRLPPSASLFFLLMPTLLSAVEGFNAPTGYKISVSVPGLYISMSPIFFFIALTAFAYCMIYNMHTGISRTTGDAVNHTRTIASTSVHGSSGEMQPHLDHSGEGEESDLERRAINAFYAGNLVEEESPPSDVSSSSSEEVFYRSHESGKSILQGSPPHNPIYNFFPEYNVDLVSRLNMVDVPHLPDSLNEIEQRGLFVIEEENEDDSEEPEEVEEVVENEAVGEEPIAEEAVPHVWANLLDPAMDIPLRVILKHADAVTFTRMAMSCTQIYEISRSFSPLLKVEVSVHHKQDTDEVFCNAYLWRNRAVNLHAMNGKQLASVAHGNFTVKAPLLRISNAIENFWIYDWPFKQALDMLEYLKVTAIDTMEFETDGCVIPDDRIPIEFFEKYKPRCYTGHFLHNRTMIAPCFKTVTNINVFVPADIWKRKEVEKFLVKTQCVVLELTDFPCPITIVKKILKLWAQKSRVISIYRMSVDFDADELSAMAQKLVASRHDITSFSNYTSEGVTYFMVERGDGQTSPLHGTRLHGPSRCSVPARCTRWNEEQTWVLKFIKKTIKKLSYACSLIFFPHSWLSWT